MDFAALQLWIGGGVVVVGMIQFVKGLFPKTLQDQIPSWAWALVAACSAIAYAYVPDGIRNALGVLAVSQIGYETILQTVKNKLGGGA